MADGTSFTLYLGSQLAVEVLPDRKMLTKVRPGLPPETLNHFIRDQVAPRVLAHEGHFVLHAAGVRCGDDVILMMGKTGRGKSTLAASFAPYDSGLIGDDAIIVEMREAPKARAVYPSLRLLPDSIAALVPKTVPTAPIAHYTSKRRIALPDVAEAPALKIDSIFVLDEPPSDGRITVKRVSPAKACMAVLANSFALDPADLEQAHRRLQLASELAKEIPAFVLSYPRDYSRLPEVRRAITGELRNQLCSKL